MATVLLIGSGGREHTLAWKLAQSPKVAKVLVLPGNGGTAAAGGKISNIADAGSSVTEIAAYAVQVSASLVVVGPEQPLVDGLVDVLNDIDIPAFGPTKKAAMLEGSKSFSKAFMVRHGIPTAEHKSFSDYDEARAYVKAVKHKVVIKASGLAAGKGVLLPETKEEALEGLRQVMVDKAFGEEACKEVVVEEMMEGPEVSVLAFCDGTSTVLMPGAQDHKRALDGDKGLNTGGMGAYAPAPVYTAAMAEMVKKEVVETTLRGAKADGFEYKGVLYAGMMLTPTGPKVVEFNCRFGDPETQVLMPLLKSDLYDIMHACAKGNLSSTSVDWHSGAAATVVAAAPGYPESYPKGLTISGADNESSSSDVMVFHAGTKQDGKSLVTSGGRVLAVTARASSIRAAIEKSYERLADVHFDGMHFRKDIGWRALLQEDEAAAAEKRAALIQPTLTALAVGLAIGFALGRRL